MGLSAVNDCAVAYNGSGEYGYCFRPLKLVAFNCKLKCVLDIIK